MDIFAHKPQGQVAPDVLSAHQSLEAFGFKQLQLISEVTRQDAVEAEPAAAEADIMLNADAVEAELRAGVADMQIAMEKAESMDWKTDPLEAERAGLWALHVIGTTRQKSAALKEGFKSKQSLQALGRLVMELISTTARQRSQPKTRNEIGTERAGGNVIGSATARVSKKISFKEDMPAAPHSSLSASDFGMKLSKILDSGDLMKLETFYRDLQAMQDGMNYDEPADVVLDSFAAAFKTDLQSGKDLRLDILTDTPAFQSGETVQRPRLEGRHRTIPLAAVSTKAGNDSVEVWKTDSTLMDVKPTQLTGDAPASGEVVLKRSDFNVGSSGRVTFAVDALEGAEREVRTEEVS